MGSIVRGLADSAAVGLLGLVVACGGSSGGSDRASPDDAGDPLADSGSDADAGSDTDPDTDPDSGSDSGADADSGARSDADAGALDPSVAPGGNFDLSLWELEEPIGSPGAPDTITPAKLEGTAGFQDSYFFTDPTDGSMTFWDPESGVTTANSSYPRSELREMTAGGAAANWPSSGMNTLSATLMSTLVPSKVCVGQIHLGTGTPSSTKPLLELYYYATGAITLGIEQTPAGGNEVEHPVGNVPLGTRWSYVISLSGSTIGLTIDGGAAKAFPMSPTFDEEGMYFKAGDYDQSAGTSATVGAKVHFYALGVFHGP